MDAVGDANNPNEATKRKSSTAVGFNNQEERVYGDDAYNLVGKLPAKQFILQKLLLGKTLSSPEARADHHAPRGCGARGVGISGRVGVRVVAELRGGPVAD